MKGEFLKFVIFFTLLILIGMEILIMKYYFCHRLVIIVYIQIDTSFTCIIEHYDNIKFRISHTCAVTNFSIT